MNIREYIEELKIHLRKLPDDDREDAISYYFEYLAEAGPNGAEEAMARLGTPAQLAAGIRADRAMEQLEDGDAKLGEGVSAVWHAGIAAVPRTILAVIVSAIVIVIFFAIIIAFFAVSIGLMAGGIIGIVAGFLLIPISGPATLFMIGCALIIGICGFFLFRFSIWMSKHLLYGIAGVFNGIRRSRQAKVENKASRQVKKADKKASRQAKKADKKASRQAKKAEKKEAQEEAKAKVRAEAEAVATEAVAVAETTTGAESETEAAEETESEAAEGETL